MNVVENTSAAKARAIGGFISDCANLIVSNLFDMNRQIDRLNHAQKSEGSDGGSTNLAENGKGDFNPIVKSSRLGATPSVTLAALASKGANGADKPEATGFESFLYNYLSAAGQSGNPLAFNYSGAMDVQGNFGAGSSSASFKTSLSQMMSWNDKNQQADMQSLGFGHGANNSTFMPLDIWAEGNYAAHGGERSGKFGMLTLGADYVVNSNFLAGFYGQFDSMK